MIWSALMVAGIGWLIYDSLYGNKRRGLPPGPPNWPLLGSTPSLSKDFIATLEGFVKRYGRTYTLWLFGEPMVMLNRLQDVKKYFTGDYSDVTSGRPQLVLNDLVQGRNAGVINSEGETWREARRFSLHTLRDFGVGKAHMESAIREEGEEMVKWLAEEAEKGPVNPKEAFATAVTNVVSRVLFNHGFPRGHEKVVEIREALAVFFDAFESPTFALLSRFPWLRHIPLFGHFGADKFLQFTSKLYTLIDKEMDEAEKNFDPSSEPASFAEAYFLEMHRRKESGRDMGTMSRHQLGRVIGDFWIAGFETTVTTLSWAPVYLTNFPETQRRIHAELDGFYGVGGRGEVGMGDRVHLPYTSAAVMELQRLANILSINVQHRLLQDAEIDGYELKRGTIVVPQISAVMKDEELFPQAKLYRPERFLDGEGKLKSVEAFLPFSLGKRACAGEPLARAELFILFTMLLREFRITAEVMPQMKPMDGAAVKPLPYKVRLERRL